MVDRDRRVPLVGYELRLYLPHALRFARLLPPDSTGGPKFLEGSLPS